MGGMLRGDWNSSRRALEYRCMGVHGTYRPFKMSRHVDVLPRKPRSGKRVDIGGVSVVWRYFRSLAEIIVASTAVLEVRRRCIPSTVSDTWEMEKSEVELCRDHLIDRNAVRCFSRCLWMSSSWAREVLFAAALAAASSSNHSSRRFAPLAGLISALY